MDKDDDYKNRSVVLPIAITIFIVFIIFCMIVLVGKVMIMWGIKSAYDELGRNSMSSSVQQKSSDEIQLEEKVLDRGNYSFRWSTDEIINLQIKDAATGQAGVSLDEVLEKHGKATDFFYSEIDDNIELTYFSETKQDYHRSNLSLTFEKNGSNYHLIRKSAHIIDELYPSLPKEDSPHLWTKDEISSLQVRDESTGKPGMSYEEIIQLFGLPQESEVFISQLDSESSQYIGLDLRYLTSDEVYKNEWVHLTLHREEDGIYRLTIADSHIERTER